MAMRYPSVPLFNIDPYFTIWSQDEINLRHPVHWTGSRNAMKGVLTVDGTPWRFLGDGEESALVQTGLTVDALSTYATFENESIRLRAVFTSPLLADDLYYASRPVCYLHLAVESLDGRAHEVTATLTASEELCLNKAGEGKVLTETVSIAGAAAIKMGNEQQPVLWRSGDDVRIDWGYLYLAAKGEASMGKTSFDGLDAIFATAPVNGTALFALAYDDIDSLIYFGEPVKAYWKKDGKTIVEAVAEAIAEYDTLRARCDAFAADLTAKAMAAGGEKYAELLSLAYRQVMAGHKEAVDKDGNVLYVSKECFSNGCAATVDVTYPSAPLYLYYNTELLKGMLRPVLRYARTDTWAFDFAPHDAGQYPLVNGQVYLMDVPDGQMPVEECGNILILMAAMAEIDGNTDFAAENRDLLEKWSRYLIEYGEDPAHQLCTDDFAGHLAHNCNLSLKAIMGIMGYARLCARWGEAEKSAALAKTAQDYAVSFLTRAKNDDGSFRLAYDQPDTFSLKYNAVWDKVWGTGLFPDSFYQGEWARYRREAMPFAVPLDNRSAYTKSDWLLWAGCLGDDNDFAFAVDLLWKAFDTMPERVAMTDWYYADTAKMVGFRHRTVQGGLFLKLLFE